KAGDEDAARQERRTLPRPLPDPPSSLHPQVAHRTLLLRPMGAGGQEVISRRPRLHRGGRWRRRPVRQNRVILTAPEASVRPACKCPILRSLTDAADAGVIGT